MPGAYRHVSPSGQEGGLETQVTMMDGAIIDELVPPGTVEQPSGLELATDTLFVTDRATSLIHAFDLDGNLLATVDTGLPGGSLAGLTSGPDGLLYFVDSAGDRVFRLDPGAE